MGNSVDKLSVTCQGNIAVGLAYSMCGNKGIWYIRRRGLQSKIYLVCESCKNSILKLGGFKLSGRI